VKQIFAAAFSAVLVWTAHAEPGASSLDAANAALQVGAADKALTVLNSLPQSAENHNLRCRVLFALEHWDAAANECEEAVRQDGGNSNDHLWLGRALGEKASRASFVSAFSLAKRSRAELEAAVRIDPRNAEAMADLGEFYSSAPGVVGGGEDKAKALEQQMEGVDVARAHELRGRIAESNKDYGSAEREYKQAVEVSRHPAFQWMTLGSFYRKRGRAEDAEAAVVNGEKAAQRDKSAGVALFNGASVLTSAKRNPALAAKMLQDYLGGSVKTEEAPAFAAHANLARLLSQLGDKDGARKQREEALSLAHDFKPALDLKF
jgi:tetratricopeptide (TPR) repeat protein